MVVAPGRFGPTVWTPANLAIPPAMWFNENSPITVDSNGRCAQWSDISGNARHFMQAALSTNPAITPSGRNGRRVLTFNGAYGLSGNTAACALTKSITQLAMFMTCSPDPSSSIARMLLFSIGIAGDTSGRASMHMRPVGFTVAQRRLDTNAGVTASIAYSSAAWHVFASEHDWIAQTVGARMDGGALTSVNTSQGSGATSATNSTDVELGGAVFGGTGQYMTGPVGEVIVLGYVPTTSDRQSIESYLAAKWM